MENRMYDRYGNKIIHYKRVFLYLRCSSPPGSKKQLHSLWDQEAECRKVAEYLWLEIVEVISEQGSAWTPNQRPQFKYMLRELKIKSPKRRRADGILSRHPSRLSRNAEEAGKFIQMLDDEHIKCLHFASYSFHKDASGIEHLTMEFARAKCSSDHQSVDVSRAAHYREKKWAMIYPVKFGYVKRKESKHTKESSLFPIPHEAQFSLMRRMFDLARQGLGSRVIVDYLTPEYLAAWETAPSVSNTDRRLTDSFYCGKWLIKPWTKKERTIDLTKIVLSDGTRFQPVLSVDEFNQIQQIRSWNRCGVNVVRKRINPFLKLVLCGGCWNRMYANYRKVKRTGWVKEEQLGYECQQKKWFPKSCTQPRIKANMMFEQIAEGILDRIPNLTKREYQQYVLFVHIFLKKKQRTEKQEKSRVGQTLKQLTLDRRLLIQQRIDLIEADAYDKHSKDDYETRVSELSDAMENLKNQKDETAQNRGMKFKSFVQFLELKRNLHQYWLAANMNQKEQISKNLLSNLIVDGQVIRSVERISPLWEAENKAFYCIGEAQGVVLEPKLQELWEWFDSAENTNAVQSLAALYSELKTGLKLEFPPAKDMGKMSGT